MSSLYVSRLSAAVLVAACVLAAPGVAVAAPFDGMAGNWTGGGSITLSDGSSERLRCRASYVSGGGGSTLQQSLRCASDSYKFELSSDVVSEGGRLSGTWSETSRGVSGSLSGRIAGGNVSAAVEAPGFSAALSLNTRGDHQSVSITSQGDIRRVSVSLSRR